MKKVFIFGSSILMGCVLVYAQDAPLITIPDGQLRGTTNSTFKDNVTYYAYRGIPFAQKPIGDLRFAPPVKNNPWTGILDATKDKDSCTQMGFALVDGSDSEVLGSEDCLYINVYTTNVTGNLPVIVWIYGGGFIYGSAAYDEYGPDYILEKNVVYVAFNYRLGVFGFLSTEDSAAPGNWGLKDQVLALKWVKQNIQHFGGDPEKITIFGQSAGSASVSYLLQSSQTTGLYRGAILQSGTSLNLWALTRNARQKAFNVGLKVGVIALTSQTLIRNLRRVDYKALKRAEGDVTTQSLLTENILAGLPFGVVKEPDHSGAVFSSKSWQLLSTGGFQRVPVIIGQTSNEVNVVASYVDQVWPVLFQYDLDVSRFAPYDLTRNTIKRLAAGTAVRNHFFDARPLSAQPEALVRFLTVDLFIRGIREAATLKSLFTQVYYYQFSYKGPLGDPNSTFPDVGHAEELNYLFVKRNRPTSNEDSITIDRFVTLWTNFVKTGNPTPSDGGSVLNGLTWEPNNAGTNANTAIKYLNIDDTLAMDINPFQQDWIFYKGLYDQYGDPPTYGTY